MKVRIDYLNKDKEVRHTFFNTEENDKFDILWWELIEILKHGTDIRVYNLTKNR